MDHIPKRKLSTKGESLYSQLSLPKTASGEEIRKHYRRLVLKYHPDKNPDPEATEKFRQITYAYSILSDENKRAIYDEYGSVGLEFAKNFGDDNVRLKLPWWLRWILLLGCIATCFCCCCCCCCCGKYKYEEPDETAEFKSFEQNALVEYAPKPEDYEVDNDTSNQYGESSNVKVTSNPFFNLGKE